jgi:hypothetical protein
MGSLCLHLSFSLSLPLFLFLLSFSFLLLAYSEGSQVLGCEIPYEESPKIRDQEEMPLANTE